MKIKLKEVLHYHQMLKNIETKKLPPKMAYAIGKNMTTLEGEIKHIEKGRVEIIEQYAVKGENGEPIIVDNNYDLGDNYTEFAADYAEFLETDTDINIQLVSEDVLEKLEDERYDPLTPLEMASIDFMLKKDTVEA